jgi:3-methyladenine DNA glycosylase Mpg
LGLSLDLDGLLLGSSSGLHVLDDGSASRVARDTRIGISKGERLPLRFFAADSPFVTHKPRRNGGCRDEIA